MREYFSEEKMLYHYLHTAKYHIKEYLSGERVKPKKYFYALRPILACTWVRTYHTAPPVLFDDLRGRVLPGELKEAVDRLLDLKINGPEKMEISPIPEINSFLDKQVQEIEQYLSSVHSGDRTTWDDLNRFFIKELQQ